MGSRPRPQMLPSIPAEIFQIFPGSVSLAVIELVLAAQRAVLHQVGGLGVGIAAGLAIGLHIAFALRAKARVQPSLTLGVRKRILERRLAGPRAVARRLDGGAAELVEPD